MSDPDDAWAVNNSGIVNLDGRTWILSVYTAANANFAAGVRIVDQVGRLAGATLRAAVSASLAPTSEPAPPAVRCALRPWQFAS